MEAGKIITRRTEVNTSNSCFFHQALHLGDDLILRRCTDEKIFIDSLYFATVRLAISIPSAFKSSLIAFTSGCGWLHSSSNF